MLPGGGFSRERGVARGGVDLIEPHGFSALFAGQPLADVPAAAAVQAEPRRASLAGVVAVTPLGQVEQDRLQGEGLLGGLLRETFGCVLVTAPFEQALLA